jgi:hypothetical protein
MRLSADQVRRFYGIWMPLLTFVNRERNLLPHVKTWTESAPLAGEEAAVLRDALWKEDPLLDAFLAQNPAGLGAGDLALAASWKNRISGQFFIFRHLKKHSIFLKSSKAYAVLGLACPIDELIPFTPCLVDAVLLPFEDRIVFDSLLPGYNITFGGGIRRSLNETYRKAKLCGDVITSLAAAAPGLTKSVVSVRTRSRL